MAKTISIGKQDFASLRENDCFFVDKTDFIREWWESQDDITLINRPRRFGKTLNMSMLHCFFSRKYEGRADLFLGLSIWQDEKYRSLQGSYPVIYFSFADVKQTNYQDAVQKIKMILADLFMQYSYLMDWNGLSEAQRKQLESMDRNMSDLDAQNALKDLCSLLYQYYGKKVILLLDEYDTPMQEAYAGGYWEKFTEFIRGLFNASFKTNPYLERALMTGITRVSKESVFSDLNNLNVITTTSEQYESAFGFTEEEVYASLDLMGLSDHKEEVKKWYDGFTFGRCKDIYNPWSITNYLDKKKLAPYWANTSSNSLISTQLKEAPVEVKEKMEQLLNGENILVNLDEQVIFSQLKEDANAIWSLLLASGYLKVVQVEYLGEEREPWYHLRITNLETKSMFVAMLKGWFRGADTNYNEFVKALLSGNVKEMNLYMNDVAAATFSSFDTGTHASKRRQPERFYHGFVLGLLAELRDRYEVRSNRESGYGRYDVMLKPKNKKEPAYLLEFKVQDEAEESTLQDTVFRAKQQIKEKRYEEELLAAGISPEQIRSYGFAFCGKQVLIG